MRGSSVKNMLKSGVKFRRRPQGIEALLKEASIGLQKPIQLEKGTYGGACYRTACNVVINAGFYNHSTRKYYCSKCAKLINDANLGRSMEMYGHDLCTWGEHKEN